MANPKTKTAAPKKAASKKGASGKRSTVPPASATVPPAVSGAVVTRAAAKKSGQPSFGEPAKVGSLADAPKQDQDLAKLVQTSREDQELTSKKTKKR